MGDGHQVTATTRRAAGSGLLQQMGAEAVVMDGLDAVSVLEAVAKSRPDAMVYQMTGIDGKPDLKHLDRWFATTNRDCRVVVNRGSCVGMDKERTTVYLDKSVLRATKVFAARTGPRDYEIADAALRG